MPPADAPGFCKEICRFQRPKSGAVNAKTKSILAFTILTDLYPYAQSILFFVPVHRPDSDIFVDRKVWYSSM